MFRAQAAGRAAASISWRAAGGSTGMRNQLGLFALLAQDTTGHAGHSALFRGAEWNPLRQQPEREPLVQRGR